MLFTAQTFTVEFPVMQTDPEMNSPVKINQLQQYLHKPDHLHSWHDQMIHPQYLPLFKPRFTYN